MVDIVKSYPLANLEEDQIWKETPDAVFKDGEAYKLVKEDKFKLSMQEQLLREFLRDENF